MRMPQKITNKHLQPQSGFTIVELMIALSVLSVLLLICTFTLINLGGMYVKGNNKAHVQDVARNLMSGISNDIRTGGAAPERSSMGIKSGSLCIGTTRYSYLTGRQVRSSPDTSSDKMQTRHALWRDTLNSSGNCAAVDQVKMQKTNPTTGMLDAVVDSGQELIPEHMRLTRLSITPVDSGALYKVEVGVAYGDNDLLCARGKNLQGGKDCDVDNITQHTGGHVSNIINPSGHAIGCTGGKGGQFCAASNLQIIVARRLSGS